MNVTIETICALPIRQFDEMLHESQDLGYGFVRRLVDEWHAGTNRFDRPGEAFFAAKAGDRLVGVCGLNQDPYSADPRCGRVRHLYVMRDLRGRGVGARLVSQVIDESRQAFDLLRLRAADDKAARFYQRLGFVRVQDVPDCTHILAASVSAR